MTIFDDIDKVLNLDDNLDDIYYQEKQCYKKSILNIIDNIFNDIKLEHLGLLRLKHTLSDLLLNIKTNINKDVITENNLFIYCDDKYNVVYDKLFEIFSMLDYMKITLNIKYLMLSNVYSNDVKNIVDFIKNKSFNYNILHIDTLEIRNMVITNFNFLPLQLNTLQLSNCSIKNCKNFNNDNLNIIFNETKLPNSFTGFNKKFKRFTITVSTDKIKEYEPYNNLKYYIKRYVIGYLDNITDNFNADVYFDVYNTIFKDTLKKIYKEVISEVLTDRNYEYNFRKKLYKIFTDKLFNNLHYNN